jgi:hypothetical protein
MPGSVTPPTGTTPETPVGFSAVGWPGRADADATVAKDGSWTTHISVPEMPHGWPTAKYPVGAVCYANEGAEAGMIQYADALLTITSKS